MTLKQIEMRLLVNRYLLGGASTKFWEDLVTQMLYLILRAMTSRTDVVVGCIMLRSHSTLGYQI